MRNFEQLQERILDELEKIAFSQTEKVTVSQKLTALRLLARYIGMDKGVNRDDSEYPELPVIIDDITDPRLAILKENDFEIKNMNRETRRALQKRKR